ncbi:MAG: hypothetical protein VXZ40_01595 [Nanoarchaeota archaeon]|nr:hypothetical protein [Nanoarchaeota archaeon]
MAKKKTFFDRVEEKGLEMAGDYVKDRVTKKIIRISEMSFAFLMAGILLTIGIVELVATFFPILQGGWNYALFGVFFLIVGLILK